MSRAKPGPPWAPRGPRPRTHGAALVVAAWLLVLAAPAASPAATGDFDGNGLDDLAIGAPGEDVATAGTAGAGTVNVLYGRTAGLSARNSDLWSQSSVGILGVAGDDERLGAALAAGDFDGDGFDDLAIGVPGDDFTPPGDVDRPSAGAVNVLYGAAGGLTTEGDQLLRQDAEAPGGIQAGAQFGWALLASDLDQDGHDELVVGAPLQDVTLGGDTRPDAGVVTIFPGRPAGLAAASGEGLHQGGAEVEPDDLFGASLAAGRFTGDRFPELVLGAPHEDLPGAADTGSILLYLNVGTTTALSGPFTQTDIGSLEEAGDRFADTLVAGDFGRSGRDDLAIGMPLEDIGGTVDAGVVNVVYTAGGELDWANPDPFDGSDVGETVEVSEAFGAALAPVDLVAGPQTDLAVGTPLENTPTAADAGSVGVLVGDDEGLSHAGGASIMQTAVGDAAEPGDFFGAALGAGNFGRLARDDLAIGSPGESLDTFTRSGLAHALYGDGGPLGSLESQRWHQNRPDVGESVEAGDLFGAALAPPGSEKFEILLP